MTKFRIQNYRQRNTLNLKALESLCIVCESVRNREIFSRRRRSSKKKKKNSSSSGLLLSFDAFPERSFTWWVSRRDSSLRLASDAWLIWFLLMVLWWWFRLLESNVRRKLQALQTRQRVRHRCGRLIITLTKLLCLKLFSGFRKTSRFQAFLSHQCHRNRFDWMGLTLGSK